MVQNKFRYFLYITMFVLLHSCRDSPATIKNIIASSNNEQELSKAVAYFQEAGDPRKLKALNFLLENMPYHEHDTGEAIENYNFLFDFLAETPENQKEFMESIWDSLVVEHDMDRPAYFERVKDIETLTADFLIDHVDNAFRAWEQPWAKDLDFADFCNFILPYKLLKERSENWMSEVQQDYAGLNVDAEDVYDACLQINNELKRRFKIRTLPAIADVTYSQLDRIRSGKCYHATQYTSYVMRTFGVPVVIDYTYWGNMNGGHEWNALIYNGKPIPFVGSESDPGKTKIDLARQRKRSKVFRHSYAIQRDEIRYLIEEGEDIPPLLRDYYMQDVTKDYIPVKDVEFAVDPAYDKRYLYLCIFNRQEWIPIYWGKSKNSRVVFPNMGRGILYLPVAYEVKDLISVSNPVIVHQDGRVEEINVDSSTKRTIVMKKKSPEGPSIIKGNAYELFYWSEGWSSIGKQVAAADSLIYDDVPDNALLWIRSKDKASNERPFLYKDGEQIWY